jgi:radical SAM-linked protein
VDKIRLRFEKTGPAAYISHLDLMRTMQRALRRADVPLRFSEGFNPHALLSILIPLPVGMESLCELMDIRVMEELDLTALPQRLTAVMPEGLRISKAWEDGRKSAELKWLRLGGTLEYDDGGGSKRISRLEELFARDSLLVLRRTKRGEGEFDLRSGLQSISFGPEEEGLAIEAVLSAQEPSVNPELLVAALRRYAPELVPDFARFVRLETLDAEGAPFR